MSRKCPNQKKQNRQNQKKQSKPIYNTAKSETRSNAKPLSADVVAHLEQIDQLAQLLQGRLLPGQIAWGIGREAGVNRAKSKTHNDYIETKHTQLNKGAGSLDWPGHLVIGHPLPLVVGQKLASAKWPWPSLLDAG